MNEYIKKMTKQVMSSFFSLVFRNLDDKKSFSLIERICVAFNNNKRYFVNYTLYPKYASDMVKPLDFGYRTNNVAIIIQGPIVERDSFTLESVRLYKKIYKECEIIVSTWNTVNSTVLKQFEKENIHVVLSEEPKYSGIGNINYQVRSTVAGIDYAKKLGAVFVLKTRTDQRMYRRNLIEYLLELINNEPIKLGCNGLKQNYRMVILEGTSAGSPVLIPGYISDFFYFGEINDISKYFSYNEERINQNSEERKKWLKTLRENNSLEEYFRLSAPEVILYENYMSKNTERQSERIKEYWEFLSNYTVGLSWMDLGLFWYKYDRFIQTNRLYGNFDIDDTDLRNLTYRNDFINWRLIQKAKIDPTTFKRFCDTSAKVIDP